MKEKEHISRALESAGSACFPDPYSAALVRLSNFLHVTHVMSVFFFFGWISIKSICIFFQVTLCWNISLHECDFLCYVCVVHQCIERLTVIQAELQDSVKELSKSRKRYQEAETMAQAVREKTELETKYDSRCFFLSLRD